MSIKNTNTILPENSFKYIMGSKTGTIANINGKDYLYFAGAAYFQLQSHPEVIKAAIDATLKYGIASGTSRAITGTTHLLLKLEQNIAEYFGTDDAVYLPSGYLSNIAGFQALEKSGIYDLIFIDESSHYCNAEGALISGKQVIKFKHRDINDLRKKIKESIKNDEKPLIASDGLFPIWANLAPVDEYLKIAEEFNGAVWIDDSHSVGILGENGRGIFEYFGLDSERLFMGATLSKAFGAYGGFVTGNSKFIKHVKSGNVLTGSSSPPNASVAAALKGIEIIKNNPEMRKKLWDNAAYLKKGIKGLGIATDENYLPIVTFTSDSMKSMQQLHKALMDKDIYIQYVKYVGSGSEGVLRIVMTSEHTKKQIDYLILSLKELI